MWFWTGQQRAYLMSNLDNYLKPLVLWLRIQLSCLPAFGLRILGDDESQTNLIPNDVLLKFGDPSSLALSILVLFFFFHSPEIKKPSCLLTTFRQPGYLLKRPMAFEKTRGFPSPPHNRFGVSTFLCVVIGNIGIFAKNFNLFLDAFLRSN